MGRKRIIGRDAILDAAEQVIRQYGGHRLSLQLVATAAGISKGAIAYSFKTKDDLLHAVFARENSRFEREVAVDAAARKGGRLEAIGTQDSDMHAHSPRLRPIDRVAARISVTRQENEAMIVKAAGLFTSMLQSETRWQALVASYQPILESIDTSTLEGRNALVALMAVEGLFLLRGLGVLRMSEEQWQEWLDIVSDTCIERA